MKNNKKKQSKINLESIKDKRDGGSIAIRGFNFQFIYASYRILQELLDYSNNSIRLEGIEDIDILHKNEFIQVKSSINPMDANIFWKMNVLKNYLEIYKDNQDFNFTFVHNTTISKGNLKGLEQKKLNSKILKYWTTKIETLNYEEDFNISKFLEKIIFKKVDIDTLISQSKKLLLDKFDLNSGTEEQFLISLLYHISKWSQQRKTIKYNDLLGVIQFVKDASSKSPTNQAIEQNLMTKVSYNTDENITDIGYFDGKSAKPIHIALGLPVERKVWQEQIKKSLNEFDITVIKSSSGQGKSTLAWQIAYDFKKEDFTVYQLNYCSNSENIEGLFDFIETRIKIGLMPLIVIDGLDQRVKEWVTLAERLFNLPIKIIVTTREEDWYRYGVDISKVQLNIIDIALQHEEAKSIFSQLKSKDKLHQDIKTWQPSWEEVESKSLLIEYIYLLTHGNMIKDRLEHQIKELNRNDNDASAKIEILRIIALSDILNIKIQTKKLTRYIQKNIGFHSDRGELYKMLEKEYYLQFDKKYIEGLHPVRSQHLVDILHQNLYIEESLINLLGLIESDSIYDFFITAPFLIDEEEKKDFFEESAQIIGEKSFIEMVYAIDGLMHYEPYNYWKINREIYDEIYDNGLINLFVNFNPPFSNLNTFEELNKTLKNDNIQYLINQKNNLSSFSLDNTSVYLFCKYLSSILSQKTIENYDSYEGLSYLIKWIKKIKSVIPKLMEFNDVFLIDELQNKEIEEVLNLYIYAQIVYPKEYLTFIDKNKEILFSILKQKTNSIIIQDRNDELDIKYITNNRMKKLNEESMKRINILQDIFIQYNKYNTQVIYLPFPNEELYKHTVQEAYKTIPKENLFDEFDIHLNVIWRKTIMKEYTYTAIYEWLEYYKNLRVKFLEFMKMCNRLFEYKLERKALKSIDPLHQEIFALLKLEKEFPIKTIKYQEIEVFKEEKSKINEFKASYKNFLNQLIGIIDNSDTHLPLANLQDANLRLLPMQKAFDSIQTDTYQYFDMEEIKKEEQLWLDRLLKTVTFFVEVPKEHIAFAKEKISSWHINKQKEEIKIAQKIIQNLEKNLGYKVYYPKKILEKKLREICIGIEDFNENYLADILYELVDFYKLDIDIINIIKIHNNKAFIGLAIPKFFFEKLKKELDTGEYEESEFGNPYPIIITNELLETLNEQIIIDSPSEDIINNTFIKIMYDIWRLIEYRNYLDKNSEIEYEWLKKNELEIINRVNEKIDILNPNIKNFIFEIIDKKRNFTKDEIVDYMNNHNTISSIK